MTVPTLPGRHGAHRGLTLIEVLVVVGVMALLSSMAMVSSGEGDEYALDMAASQIIDTVDRARTLAGSSRLAHGVVFDVEGDRFALVDENGEPVNDALTKRPYVRDFISPGQPRGVDLSVAVFGSAVTTALFDSDGVPVSGGALILVRGKASRTLSLDAATGRMQ